MLKNYLCYTILCATRDFKVYSWFKQELCVFFFIMCILYPPMRFSLPALQNPQFLFSWKVCFENSRAREIKNTFSRVLRKREILFDINGKHKKRDIGKCAGVKKYNVCWLIKFFYLIYITTFKVVNATMVLFNIIEINIFIFMSQSQHYNFSKRINFLLYF